MKGSAQSVICQGQFNGGEIEPGTFHISNIQKCVSGDMDGDADHHDMPDYDGDQDDQETDVDGDNPSDR